MTQHDLFVGCHETTDMTTKPAQHADNHEKSEAIFFNKDQSHAQKL
jgi:hypothetical protein